MDWIKQSWEKEDAEYFPKRNVGNRGSRHHPHIIGSFFSPKMNRVVEYESKNEYLLYSFLEIDNQTVRYYVQPVEISIPFIKKSGKSNHWLHVPDVLVFRNQYKPHLFQVKDTSHVPTEKDKMVNAFCTNYARDQSWAYKVVYPKHIPRKVAQNVEFLMGFLRPMNRFESLIPEVVSRLMFLKTTTIDQLSKGFQDKVHPLQVLPIIYHLIASGKFYSNINNNFDENSEVMISSGYEHHFLLWGDELDSQSTQG